MTSLSRGFEVLAFRMEDVIDEFKYKLEDANMEGLQQSMKKRVQHVKVWRRLAQELCDINTDLEDAARQREHFALPEGFGGGGERHAASTNDTACFAREEDLVGIKDNAGSKTTLVKHVYKIVREDFDISAWVTVSKSYQVKDLLKKIAGGLGISVDVSNMETGSLGRLLSCKPPTLSEWKKVYEELELQSKDYEIKRRRLIRHGLLLDSLRSIAYVDCQYRATISHLSVKSGATTFFVQSMLLQMIRMTRIEILPEAIGRLQNLEVLDALGTGLTSLPKSMAKLKKLRFLYACTMVSEDTFHDYGGVKMPRGIGNLTGLQALQNVKACLETLYHRSRLEYLVIWDAPELSQVEIEEALEYLECAGQILRTAEIRTCARQGEQPESNEEHMRLGAL
ncbi:hypothetical protein EJB05_53054, partial [Eragrostis curvula]